MTAVAGPTPDLQAAACISRDPQWNALLRTTLRRHDDARRPRRKRTPEPNPRHIQCRLLPGGTPEQTLATLQHVTADPQLAITIDGPIDPIPEMAAGASDSSMPAWRVVRATSLPPSSSKTHAPHARDERVLTQASDEATEYGYQMLKVMSAKQP